MVRTTNAGQSYDGLTVSKSDEDTPSCRDLCSGCHEVTTAIERVICELLGAPDADECKEKPIVSGTVADLQQSLQALHIRLDKIYDRVLYVHTQIGSV
jgi:hypothetical protein